MTPATDFQLIGFSALHLAYEVRMWAALSSVAGGLRGGFPIPAELEKNAFVESYAIHLRNLIDFLYIEPRSDDVSAVHFVADPAEWLKKRGDIPDVLSRARERAHKQIAHLTWRRYEDDAPEKTWHVAEESRALTPVLKLFVKMADPNKLHSIIRQQVSLLSS